ncbi:MAG TPA: hypothetical protein VFZ11_15245 [Gemmatimonadaceae bacterium]
MSATSLLRPVRACLLGAAAVVLVTGSAAAQSSADEQAVAAYRLTMPALKKAGQATERMLELVLRDEGLARELETLAEEEDEESDQSISDIVAAYERMPKLKGAITGTGLTVREFVVMQLAMLQSALVVAFQDAENTGKEITIPPGISKENVAFVRANWDELQRMSRRTQALQEELEARARAANGGGEMDESSDEEEGAGEPEEAPALR